MKTAAVARAIVPGGAQSIVGSFVLVIMLLSVTGLAQQSRKPSPGHLGRKRAAVPVAVPVSPPVEAPPLPPPPPPTPEQMPPGVPQVSWDGEQLTIHSDNSTLADILTAVRRLTGAEIDVPNGASSERVAARLGPGPAREILGSLLSGTDFNYVIQAADENPLGIQSVLLTARNKGLALGSKSGIMAAMQRPDSSRPVESSNLQPAEKMESSLNGSSTPEKNSAEASSSTDTRTASAAVPPTSADPKAANAEPPDTPAEPLPVQADLTPPAAPSEIDPNRPKTIQDKIQDMQSLFEQRRQMIEQSRKPQSSN